MKPLLFLGNSKKLLLKFPAEAKREAGYQLHRVQQGNDPHDWKSMQSIGQGVREIRLHVSGEHRVIYLASVGASVYVLHAFGKKTQRTPKAEIDIAKANLKHLMEVMR